MEVGFIKLFRKFKNWEWYDDIPTKTLFIHLALGASFKDTSWRGMDFKRGQLRTGRKKLAEETGLTEQQIRTSLDKLEKTGEINQQTTNRFTLITLNNFDHYQQSNQQITNKQPTDNQQITTIEEVPIRKEVKEGKEIVTKIKNNLEKSIDDFIEMRKKIKKPLTKRAIELTLSKLQKLAPGDEEKKIKILNNSIMNCWQGIFQLKDEKPQLTQPQRKPKMILTP